MPGPGPMYKVQAWGDSWFHPSYHIQGDGLPAQGFALDGTDGKVQVWDDAWFHPSYHIRGDGFLIKDLIIDKILKFLMVYTSGRARA